MHDDCIAARQQCAYQSLQPELGTVLISEIFQHATDFAFCWQLKTHLFPEFYRAAAVQVRYSYEQAVCLSVCQTREL